MYCTRCGKEIRIDQKFCGNCGAKNVNYQEKNDLKEMIEKAAAGEENALEKIYNLTYRNFYRSCSTAARSMARPFL